MPSFIVYNELYSWPMGQVACKLLRGSYSVNLYSGMLMLACISTDRYIAIVQARRSFRLRSVSNSRIICFLIWIFALLVSVPTFHFNHWYEPSHHEITWFNSTEEEETTDPQYVCEWKFDDSNTASIVKVAVPSTQLAIGFFLPLLIMIFCYTSVIITLQKAKNFQRHKAVRVVMVVVLVFIACHLPYNLALHCCLNPLLYALMGVKFRNHFRRIFQNLCCLGQRYLAPRRITSDICMSTVHRSVDGS